MALYSFEYKLLFMISNIKIIWLSHVLVYLKVKLPRTEVVNLEKIRIKWSGKGLIPWENKF